MARFADLLLAAGVATSEQIQQAVQRQEGTGRSLGFCLVDAGVIDETTLCRYLAQQHEVPYLDAARIDGIASDAVKHMTRAMAAQLLAVPVDVENGYLVVACSDPDNLERMGLVGREAALPVRGALATRTDIVRALARLYGIEDTTLWFADDTASAAIADADPGNQDNPGESESAPMPGDHDPTLKMKSKDVKRWLQEYKRKKAAGLLDDMNKEEEDEVITLDMSAGTTQDEADPYWHEEARGSAPTVGLSIVDGALADPGLDDSLEPHPSTPSDGSRAEDPSSPSTPAGSDERSKTPSHGPPEPEVPAPPVGESEDRAATPVRKVEIASAPTVDALEAVGTAVLHEDAPPDTTMQGFVPPGSLAEASLGEPTAVHEPYADPDSITAKTPALSTGVVRRRRTSTPVEPAPDPSEATIDPRGDAVHVPHDPQLVGVEPGSNRPSPTALSAPGTALPPGVGPSAALEVPPPPGLPKAAALGPQFTDRYQFIDRIGLGGMAEVWRARVMGAQGFRRMVVVKKILPEFTTNSDFIDMFIDEAMIACRLSHPNIAQVYELAEEDGEFYIAMEYVDGPDLMTIFEHASERNRPLTPAVAAYIVEQICEGLDYAHRKTDDRGHPLNIVHRDVTPHNVLVSYEGHVKVIDFGIAKAAQKLSVTRVGYMKGKPGYIAPEQALGMPIDRRVDVFAAGIILYELLTTERLFSDSADALSLKKLAVFDPRPLLRWKMKIPGALRTAAIKALQARPESRFEHAMHLGTTLRQFLRKQKGDPRQDLMKYLRTELPPVGGWQGPTDR